MGIIRTIKQKTLLQLILFTIALTLAAVLVVPAFVTYLYIQLPAVAELADIELRQPLKIYTADEVLIAEIGEQKRSPVTFENVPPLMVAAFTAAEDRNFFNHWGVSFPSLLRAGYQYITNAEKKTGASTITMQVARNFYLSRERTLARKFNEILLAFKIEQELPKQQIFELYINKIFFGFRSYGIVAAADTYYGRSLNELTIAQMAMIAGLPKAPSKYNPESRPQRAKERRDWILQRMLTLKHINDTTYAEAVSQPITAKPYAFKRETIAGYVSEKARLELLNSDLIQPGGVSKEELYNNGYHVYTTVNSTVQNAAQVAIIKGLLDYENRHGYRGAEKHYPQITADVSEDVLQSVLEEMEDMLSYSNQLPPALVVAVHNQSIELRLRDRSTVTIAWPQLKWARKFITVNSRGPKLKTANEIVKIGDLVRIRYVIDTATQQRTWELSQIPAVQGAFVALNPNNGAILAETGGFHYLQSPFNRAEQSVRTIGSTIKPLLYSYAFTRGYSAGSIIDDAPLFNDNFSQADAQWRPQNSSLTFLGPTMLRKALYKSRNLVSIRLLQQLNIKQTQRYLMRFGLQKKYIPPDLSLALGTASATPLTIARSFSSFVNTGFLVKPFIIAKINDKDGNTIYQAQPKTVCDIDYSPELALPLPDYLTADVAPDCFTDNERIIKKDISYIMYDILKGIYQQGTARQAKAILKRDDLGGKTGTTNKQVDAWFTGLHPFIVTSAWIGYDQPTPLGRSEYGAAAAMPMWIEFIKQLDNLPTAYLQQPHNITSVFINPQTGEQVQKNFPNAVSEIFRDDNLPPVSTQIIISAPTNGDASAHNSAKILEVFDQPEDIFK